MYYPDEIDVVPADQHFLDRDYGCQFKKLFFIF